MLALLPESWSWLIINLNRDLPRLSLEDMKRAILQEDFRRRELASADGAGAASIGRGYDSGRGRGQGGGRFGGSNYNGGRGSGSYGNETRTTDAVTPDSTANEQEEGEEEAMEAMAVAEEPAAVGKVTLHSLEYWVIDSGATCSMTPRADLLTELEPSPVKHVTSALGQRAEVKGMGKDIFKGADGKMVGLKNVLWVPNLAANLISVRRLQKAGMDTSSKGAKTYSAGIGERVHWDLHQDRMSTTRCLQGAAQGPASATGECDWLTLHRQMGHVALPILQHLVKNEMVAGIRVKRKPTEALGCPTCMQAKFTRFPFSSSEATAKAPLDEVVMDVVGPLMLGAAGAEYFLPIVDVYTRMTWVYVLSKKSDVTETLKIEWLPMVERQQDWLVKAIRTDRGGEFLSKEF
ncbi:unnamed protein product [Closterium sp. NIES-53]